MSENTEKARIEYLVKVLNEASKAYYDRDKEVMSNYEYDKLYDELLELEKSSGIVLPESPTGKVGGTVQSQLPKERHASRMLSLDKTKDIEVLKTWLGDKKGLLSWKLDGLTLVLTYEDGKLVKAVTRGNGEIGEVVTENAKAFDNVPETIKCSGKVVLRGEAVIKYSDFEKINEEIPDADAKYKNPRNLCSGSVRQLDSKITRQRHVHFFAFNLVENTAGNLSSDSRQKQIEELMDLGFDTVYYKVVMGASELEKAVKEFNQMVEEYDIPSDGLVLTFDDAEYGKSLGATAKFPRDSIAFKWKDEIKETTLLEIEWSASRTGLINPVAIFEPVELEGTTVSRASVHNVSVMKELKLGIGDRISVYKANMIIPQIAGNTTASGNIEIPETCPVCGGETQIKGENGVETLHCLNPECPAKHLKAFAHFVARDAMNVEGFSEATAEKFISCGILREPADVFKLLEHREEIVAMDGFGEKSYNNLVTAADKARKTTAARLLYGLGVAGIGVANAKNIARHCGDDWEKMQNLSEDELKEIEGIGDIMAADYRSYFEREENCRKVGEILKEVEIAEGASTPMSGELSGKTFVITGSLNNFANRDELKALIESKGGKVAGSVSAKTAYLINNDSRSGSTKNKKAKELGVQIITEAEFADMFLQN